MEIREATAADRRAIHDVTLAAYEQYAAGMPPALWQGYRRNIVATLADPAPAAQLVAEETGAVVGAVLLFPAAPGARDPELRRRWPEVRLLAVAPAEAAAAASAPRSCGSASGARAPAAPPC